MINCIINELLEEWTTFKKTIHRQELFDKFKKAVYYGNKDINLNRRRKCFVESKEDINCRNILNDDINCRDIVNDDTNCKDIMNDIGCRNAIIKNINCRDILNEESASINVKKEDSEYRNALIKDISFKKRVTRRAANKSSILKTSKEKDSKSAKKPTSRTNKESLLKSDKEESIEQLIKAQSNTVRKKSNNTTSKNSTRKSTVKTRVLKKQPRPPLRNAKNLKDKNYDSKDKNIEKNNDELLDNSKDKTMDIVEVSYNKDKNINNEGLLDNNKILDVLKQVNEQIYINTKSIDCFKDVSKGEHRFKDVSNEKHRFKDINNEKLNNIDLSNKIIKDMKLEQDQKLHTDKNKEDNKILQNKELNVLNTDNTNCKSVLKQQQENDNTINELDNDNTINKLDNDNTIYKLDKSMRLSSTDLRIKKINKTGDILSNKVKRKKSVNSDMIRMEDASIKEAGSSKEKDIANDYSKDISKEHIKQIDTNNIIDHKDYNTNKDNIKHIDNTLKDKLEFIKKGKTKIDINEENKKLKSLFQREKKRIEMKRNTVFIQEDKVDKNKLDAANIKLNVCGKNKRELYQELHENTKENNRETYKELHENKNDKNKHITNKKSIRNSIFDNIRKGEPIIDAQSKVSNKENLESPLHKQQIVSLLHKQPLVGPTHKQNTYSPTHKQNTLDQQHKQNTTNQIHKQTSQSPPQVKKHSILSPMPFNKQIFSSPPKQETSNQVYDVKSNKFIKDSLTVHHDLYRKVIDGQRRNVSNEKINNSTNGKFKDGECLKDGHNDREYFIKDDRHIYGNIKDNKHNKDKLIISQNEYKSSTIIPHIKSDDEDSLLFIEPSFVKDLNLNSTVRKQSHEELEGYFNICEEFNVLEVFPNIKDVTNYSPNKWV